MRSQAASAAFLLLVGGVAVAGAPFAGAYPDGPPPAHTGGFGEPTCGECHFGNGAGNAPGTLTLEGVPDHYTPGESYPLRIVLRKEGLQRGGFQLAARFAGGARDAEQGGALVADEERTAVRVADALGVHYAQQTEAGSRPETPDSATWTVEWTAPDDAAGPVVFHAAANVGNGDDSPFGDEVYLVADTSAAPRPHPHVH